MGRGGIAALATLYTALGGLKSVAVTDSLQFAVMTVAGLIIWCLVWNQAGGWDGITQRLNDHQTGLAQELLQIRHDNIMEEDVRDVAPAAIQRRLLTGGTYDFTTGV